MSRDNFSLIHELIKDHPVFSNNSKNPQVASSKQLAVALRRLASESSTAGSVMNMAQVFGIGEGTVTLYTKRVTKALVSLWGDVVKWPSIEERAQMKLRLLADAEDNGWPLWQDCIGIVDGTLVPFKGRPLGKEESAEYFNFRKAKYGLQVTLIVDDKRRVLVSSMILPPLPSAIISIWSTMLLYPPAIIPFCRYNSLRCYIVMLLF